MAIEVMQVYDAESGAKALNVSKEWVAKWIARGVQRGMIVEQDGKGSGKVLGRDLIAICRKFYQDYEDAVRWNAFNRQREREGLGIVGEL